MPAVTVRNIPEATHRAIKHRARLRGVSAEAEIRTILEEAVRPPERVKLGTWLYEHFPAVHFMQTEESTSTSPGSETAAELRKASMRRQQKPSIDWAASRHERIPLRSRLKLQPDRTRDPGVRLSGERTMMIRNPLLSAQIRTLLIARQCRYTTSQLERPSDGQRRQSGEGR